MIKWFKEWWGAARERKKKIVKNIEEETSLLEEPRRQWRGERERVWAEQTGIEKEELIKIQIP